MPRECARNATGVLSPLNDATGWEIRTQTMRQRNALSVRWDDLETVARQIAEETPVAISYNGLPYAVMMATAADLEDFGIGFSITEQVVSHPSQILNLEIRPEDLGVRLSITIDKGCLRDRLIRRQRNVTGRTGCGLCGVRQLEDAVLRLPPVAPGEPIHSAAIWAALDDLPSSQALNAETHAVHAAAWAAPGGNLLAIREDVGRHNALDKLAGAIASAALNPRSGFCVITSRCSYEMVQKAALAGISIIVAISAPTELAIRQAEAAGVTLVALARSDGFAVYSHNERIITPRTLRARINPVERK
jgi:FdhD protein